MNLLLTEIRGCTHCAGKLPFAPKPILNFESAARILIAGQAPGVKAHDSATPWNDASGERLRQWLGIERDRFYDPTLVAIVPMGFCYPGKGRAGDLPPREECAALWQEKIHAQLRKIRLRIVIGEYAQAHYLPERGANLTETVQSWRLRPPGTLALPHPSPRNNLWLKRNPWFEEELLPHVRAEVQRALAQPGGARPGVR